MKSNFKNAQVRTSVMEAETISKNGASPKSQTSRGNIMQMAMKKRLLLVGVITAMSLCAFHISCEDDSETNTEKIADCYCKDSGSSLTDRMNPGSWGGKTCGDLETKLNIEASKSGLKKTYSCGSSPFVL